MMSSSEKTIYFWTVLFEENDLTPQLNALAEEGASDNSFPSSTSIYGQVNVKVVPASSMGENFMSDTFIIETRSENEEESRTAFIKALPKSALMRECSIASDVFAREIGMYRNVFTLIRELRGDRSIPLDVPELYYSTDESQNKTCIIFEDLKAKGFRVTGKVQGSDLPHARLIVTSLAHYSALTMTALRNWKQLSSSTLINYPDGTKFLVETSAMLDADSLIMADCWLINLIELTKELELHDLTDWLKELYTNLDQLLKWETLESAGKMACITHGDYWNNNFMFRYDANGQPGALRMVDFQMARIGHPINDLLFFFYSSTLPELREKHMMDLFRLYFDTLKTDQDLLDSNVSLDYTWEEFLDDYRKRSKLVFLLGGMVTSLILHKEVTTTWQDKDKDIDNVTKTKRPVEIGKLGVSIELEEGLRFAHRNECVKGTQMEQ